VLWCDERTEFSKAHRTRAATAALRASEERNLLNKV